MRRRRAAQVAAGGTPSPLHPPARGLGPLDREVSSLGGVRGDPAPPAGHAQRRHLALALPIPAEEALALWAMRFTPLVAVQGDALVLDVTGVAHLFGGEAALLRRVLEGLDRLGVAACGVVAGAPGTALALARSGVSGLLVPSGGEAAAVAEVPLQALRLDAELVAALARLGLRRVGEVRRQPRGPLARRFGQALLLALDEAAGELARPLSPIRPPPELQAVRGFLEPLITREAIDIAVAELARGLCGRLARAGRGARRVVLRAFRVDGAVQELAVGAGLPTRDPAHLLRLLSERLERLEPGFGFDRMTLGAEVTEPLGALQTGLSERPEALAQLLDRLAQRLAVWRLAPRPSHWPEREVARIAPQERPEVPPGWPRAPRPVRLLRRPVELGAMALLPDAPPSLLRIGRASHRVRRAEGPERLTPEWWRDPETRQPRDYYRVELENGARLWVCRVGFGAEARWYLHGHLP